MPGEGKPFTSETASEAGKKSKRKGIEQQVQDFLAENWKDGEEKTRLQLIYDALLKHGLKGNVKAFEVLMDRGFGKAKQNIQLSGGIELTKAQIVINGKPADDES